MKTVIAIVLVLYTEWLAKQIIELKELLPFMKKHDSFQYTKGKRVLRDALKQRLKARRYLKKLKPSNYESWY